MADDTAFGRLSALKRGYKNWRGWMPAAKALLLIAFDEEKSARLTTLAFGIGGAAAWHSASGSDHGVTQVS